MEARPVVHPKREGVFHPKRNGKYLRPPRRPPEDGEPPPKDPRDDPGGIGWQIVRELAACGRCARERMPVAA